jgi:hypothetical protein
MASVPALNAPTPEAAKKQNLAALRMLFDLL